MENKVTLTEMVELVKTTNNYATMYTKEDVLKILADIKENEVNKLTDDQIIMLKKAVKRAIEHLDKTDVVTDFEFNIVNGDRLEVEDYNFDDDKIYDEVEYAIDNFINED
jgi:hypothetical protein